MAPRALTAARVSANLLPRWAISASKTGGTMEATAASMMTFGVAALLASWVVLLIESWKDDYAWGLCTLLLPPLSYLYALARLDKAGQALLLAVVGWVLIWLAL
jgi:hypothetical protein